MSSASKLDLNSARVTKLKLSEDLAGCWAFMNDATWIASANAAEVLVLGDSMLALMQEEWQGHSGKQAWSQYILGECGLHGRVVNFSIGGSMTQHWIHRIEQGVLQHVKKEKCKLILLMIGTNNCDDDPAVVAVDIHNIMDLLYERLPNAKILLLSVPPCEDAEKRAKTDAITNSVQGLGDVNRVNFHDIRSAFYIDGDARTKLNTSLYYDGVHWNNDGYDVFCRAFVPKLKELLGIGLKVATAPAAPTTHSSSFASSSSSSSLSSSSSSLLKFAAPPKLASGSHLDLESERVKKLNLPADSMSEAYVTDWCLTESAKVAEVIFLGDSITAMFTQEYAGRCALEVFQRHIESAIGKTYMNFGIGGSMTQHLIWRIEHGFISHVNPDKCKLVYFMIGTNNHEDKPAIVANEIDILIGMIQERLPKAKILLLSVLPMCSRKQTVNNNGITELIKHFNNPHRDAGVYFYDVRAAFYLDVGGGKKRLDRGLFYDGLHLNEKGYEVYFNAFVPKLLELLGKGPEPTPPRHRPLSQAAAYGGEYGVGDENEDF